MSLKPVSDAYVPFSGIVMIIDIEIIEGKAEVIAEEGMTMTGIVREREIIVAEAEAAV